MLSTVSRKGRRPSLRQISALAMAMAWLAACSLVSPQREPREGEVLSQYHEDVLDHYVCYRLVEPPAFVKPNLQLIDQFFIKPRIAITVGPEYLCNPARKEGSRRSHPNEHLVCYNLQQAAAVFHATIANQLRRDGVKVVTVFERVLCIPSGKSTTSSPPPEPERPRVVDHFKCYTAPGNAPNVGRRVRLDDQFGTFFRNVLRESWLCNPTEKVIDGQQHGPMLHNLAHLVCYPLNPEGPVPPPTIAVRIRNQFHEVLPLTVIKDPSVLCVPSSKTNAGPGP